MKRMELAHYKTLVEGAKVLARDAHGVKVLETVEGNIVKLFRRKRTFSSAFLYPYAAGFARNARRLQRSGFRTVKVLGVYRIAALKRDCVVYCKIPGRVVREKTGAQPEGLKASADLMLKISALMASLHREGFYFRSAHLGNLVVMPDGELALIDVSDFRWWPFGALPLGWRVRNLGQILRYPEDCQVIRRWGETFFAESYIAETRLPPRRQEILRNSLRTLFREAC